MKKDKPKKIKPKTMVKITITGVTDGNRMVILNNGDTYNAHVCTRIALDGGVEIATAGHDISVEWI